MRNKHHRTNHKLGKRAFALCLALAVICSCLLPVFATETGGIAVMPMDGGFAVDTGFGVGGEDAGVAVQPMDGGFAVDTGVDAGTDTGFAVDPMDGGFAVDTGEDADVDTGMTPGTGIVVTPPVVDEGSSSSASTSGPTIITKETEYGTVTEYDWGDSQTTWKDDEITITPNDNLKEDDAAFGVLPIEYHFWLQQLDSFTFDTLSYEAEMAEMSVTEYLALFGSSKQFPIWHMDTIADTDTISNYKFADPTAKDDPEGQNREFAYWYTVDENGVETEFDPYKSYGSETETTVNVYAAWKDGTVGSDEEEDVDHEDLVDKNPVPVDLTAKASTSYEDEEGNLKTTTLPVEVKNLPSAADHVSVIHMGGDDMERFYKSHLNDFGSMAPILGLKISPKNAKGEKVQPAKGEKATVTVSGLDALPYMVKATAGELKVLHQTADGSVETLDVLSYQNGTLTFETSSFSPFVLVRAVDALMTLDERASYAAENKNYTVQVGGQPIEISGSGSSSVLYSGHSWSSSNSSVATVTFKGNKATVTGVSIGEVTITHKYNGLINSHEETFTVRVIKKLKSGEEEAEVYFLHDMTKNANENGTTHWRGPVLVNGSNAVVNTTDAIWEGGVEGTTVYENKNIKQNVSNYIVNWPDLKTGTTWKLDKTVRTQQVDGGTIEDVVYKNFLSQLKEAGMTDAQLDEITAKDIDITLVPYKISQRNNTDPDKHIDCNIVITCNSAYTAKFNVKLPTDTVYETRSTKIYLNDEKVLKCNGDSEDNIKKYSPESITDSNGVKWDFDGWYPEDTDGTGPNLKATPIQDGSWPYTVQDYQLTNNNSDRVVNFYAHYKKATSNVTITKQVTGLLGDTHKDFNFNVSITQNNVACTGVTAKKDGKEVTLTGFTLTHGETVTLENVPIGATINVTEVTPGEHYNVSATGHSDEQNGGRDVTFTYGAVANTATASDTDEADLMLLSMDEGTAVDTDGDAVAYDVGARVKNNQIIVTNHCGLIPDTGVLLDTLPYIVILAVVAGGGILLMLRKHRKEDD